MNYLSEIEYTYLCETIQLHSFTLGKLENSKNKVGSIFFFGHF